MRQLIAHRWWKVVPQAFLLAVLLVLLYPAHSFASAGLVHSDPADNAVLRVAPKGVRMWFSEALDRSPTLSTAVVVDAANHGVEQGNAQVVGNEARELDVPLRPLLAPGSYIVAWSVASADDGYLSSGTIRFTLLRPNGSLPPQQDGQVPGTPSLGGDIIGGTQPEASPWLSFLLTTLLEATIVFWVGAQLFVYFVLQMVAESNQEASHLMQQVQTRFERRWAVPALLLLFFANSSILMSQALATTGGDWPRAFEPGWLMTILTHGSFALFGLIREVLLVLALRLAFYRVQIKQIPKHMGSALSWIDLFIALALLITMASSSHATTAQAPLLLYAVLADWLHLLAAALWVGGLLFLAACYLPLLRQQHPVEQAHALLTMFPAYAPWALAGMVLMALTGPFSTTIHVPDWVSLLTTLYGQVLMVKILLVGGLICLSGLHIWLLHPRLKRALMKQRAMEQEYLPSLETLDAVERETDPAGDVSPAELIKQQELLVARYTHWLRSVLWWEAVLGVSTLLCVGAMTSLATPLT